jgi:hypothetical protein
MSQVTDSNYSTVQQVRSSSTSVDGNESLWYKQCQFCILSTNKGEVIDRSLQNLLNMLNLRRNVLSAKYWSFYDKKPSFDKKNFFFLNPLYTYLCWQYNVSDFQISAQTQAQGEEPGASQPALLQFEEGIYISHRLSQ